jgi:Leucine-rich repeat (LRR) protein
MLIRIKYQNNNREYYFNSLNEINNFDKNNYDKVLYIICEFNRLTSLLKLPNSLELLHCEYNKLSSLPELPNSLQKLYCGGNKLTSLPEFPKSLIKFIWSNDKLMKKRQYKYLIKIIYL